MNEYLQIASFAVVVIANIVGIVWNWAKLDKRIAIMEQKFNDKIDTLVRDIKDIKMNELVHLKEDVKEISYKLTEHLIEHGK